MSFWCKLGFHKYRSIYYDQSMLISEEIYMCCRCGKLVQVLIGFDDEYVSDLTIHQAREAIVTIEDAMNTPKEMILKRAKISDMKYETIITRMRVERDLLLKFAREWRLENREVPDPLYPAGQQDQRKNKRR